MQHGNVPDDAAGRQYVTLGRSSHAIIGTDDGQVLLTITIGSADGNSWTSTSSWLGVEQTLVLATMLLDAAEQL